MPKTPDARVQIDGRVFELFLTKDEHGWGAIAYSQNDQINPFAAAQEDDHDFRSNAIGDVVATIFQIVTPGSGNDDHHHDQDEEFADG